MLGFDLDWICMGFVPVTVTSVSSSMQLPWCGRKDLLPCSHPLPLALTLFPPHLPQWFLNCEVDRDGIYVFFAGENSVVSCSWNLGQLWVCYYYLLQEGASQMRVRHALFSMGIPDEIHISENPRLTNTCKLSWPLIFLRYKS